MTARGWRAQAAEKVLDASKHILTSNPEPTNISDRHCMLSNEPKILVLRAEGYTLLNFVN